MAVDLTGGLTILVVDTDQYAGNFERQMVAYMTGRLGDCAVGEKEAEAFALEFPDRDFESLVCSVPDEYGCWRPASIYESPYYWNDGLGGSWENGRDFDDPEIMESYKKEWDLAFPSEAMRFGTFPSYCSVACFLHEIPTVEEVDFLTRRAKEFASSFKKYDGAPYNITVRSVRIIKTKLLREELYREVFDLPKKGKS